MEVKDYIKIESIIDDEIIKIARKKKGDKRFKVYEIQGLIDILDNCKSYVDLEGLNNYRFLKEEYGIDDYEE